MKIYDVYWSPTGQKIATVKATNAKAAKRKAPQPYRKYLGEIYVVEKNSNPTSTLGDWIPAHAVRMLSDGRVQILKERNPGRKRRNVEMGFRDSSGIFHPIRASEDYEEALVGTHPVESKRRKRKATPKKKVAKKKAKGKRKNPNHWDVIVGNVGTVYSGSNGFEAQKKYSTYVAISKSGSGRAGNESVTLMKNGEIVKEHYGDYE